jgi:hypothetical protein
MCYHALNKACNLANIVHNFLERKKQEMEQMWIVTSSWSHSFCHCWKEVAWSNWYYDGLWMQLSKLKFNMAQKVGDK